MQQKSVSSDRRSSQAAPTDDSVEPMHRGARAEPDGRGRGADDDGV
jgi:hypothetical protein